ncbi:Protein POLLEN DEFECTIVE IN GUIDANCE 1 [Labeo rohita]|uniref:Protein POLLEN DEFECTIVE IN GUIDANCE 1 n=1 Tax=Labeo rohita TaxID=84645 RepID=A0ABQ8L9K4_LABRO|nr:Protein POLLEN DEFECTIVE IN GUIDANCE 1 [Labeo rohita]
MRSAAAGLEVIQMRAEGSRFPTMRFISNTSTEADSDILHSFTLLLKSRDRRHSSRPSKINNTSYSSQDIFTSCVLGKNILRRSERLSVLFFIRLNSLKGSGNMSWTS